jgi:hypothetical protein
MVEHGLTTDPELLLRAIGMGAVKQKVEEGPTRCNVFPECVPLSFDPTVRRCVT